MAGRLAGLAPLARQIQAAWDGGDGNALAALLARPAGVEHHQLATFLSAQGLAAHLDQAVAANLLAVEAGAARRTAQHTFTANETGVQVQVLQAFLFELKCLEHFVKCFGVKPTSEGTPTDWLLPPMQMLLSRFKLTCFQHTESVTRQLVAKEAVKVVRPFFNVCNKGAKRAGILHVVNTMYSFCVATGDPTAVTSNVKGMEQVVEGQHLLESTIPFSMAQRVTYQYYFGRGRVFTGDVATAEDRLGFAFEQCHRDCRLNKRCILVYLVPARMLRGRLPSVRLLQKYNLPQYLDLREAVRQGNLSAFQRTMDAHQAFFIRTGVYMALERLRTVVTRNLFQKVHATHVAMTREKHPGDSDNDLLRKGAQIPLEYFQAALDSLESDEIDIDETECIVANLIHRKFMSGFIHHERRLVVVSKKAPFPPLAGVPTAM